MAVAAVADREETDSLQSYYDEHGYVVVRRLIHQERIARLLAVYTRDIVPSQQRFFRQNSSRYERNRINDYGYVRQPFVDIHDYQRFPEFSAAAREIFCSNELMETISAVTGASRHNLMQTMLFDLNTATRPHQDWYDLDSVPNGSLIAACIALEDIREEAGRFHVMRFYRNQPEYSPLNHLVYAVKAGVYTYPMLRERLRKLLEFGPSRPGA